MQIIDATRAGGNKPEVIREIKDLIGTCDDLERRWVNQRRVVEIILLCERAAALEQEVEQAGGGNWREVAVRLQ